MINLNKLRYIKLNKIKSTNVDKNNENNYNLFYFKNIYTKEKFNENLLFKNIIKIKSDNESSSIDANNILITKHYNKLNFNPENINEDYINYIDSFILIVDFYNGGGGTTQFINHIVSNYKMHKIFLIVRNYSNKIIFTINDEYQINKYYNNSSAIQFLQNKINCIEKIFVNHTLGHDIEFLNEIVKLNKELTFITHDFYLINDIPNPMIHNIENTYINNSKLNINIFNQIITQNEKNLLILNNHITNKKTPLIITELPDYREKLELINTLNNKIVIGIFGAISNIKGLNILNSIINYYDNNDSIEIIVFGLCDIKNFENQYIYYNIEHLNELLIKFKPNILIELSICSETYSYTLSLKMITDLPIIYFKKTGNFVVENRLSGYNKAYPFETLDEFDKLIKLHKQDYFYTIKPIIYFNNFWDKYFKNLKKEKIINKNNNFKNNVNIYPIYFPQFHSIRENNISFYEGYTDIINLNLLLDITKTETPNLKEFDISNICEYDLTNINIIQKQIDILEDYNLSGFAIYYYWFSTNTITDKHMIMDDVVNIFFSNLINLKNKKIFFIWANENWSDNPAFGNCDHTIKNDYTESNLIKNANNLVKYFKHENYLKKDNKPVLLLYHTWFMTINEILLLEKILNNICIENNFDGINLITNCMNKDVSYNFIENKQIYLDYKKLVDFDTFYLNFNYKDSTSTSNFIKNKQIYLDYKTYIDEFDKNNITKTNIETLVFDFDNRARLYKPPKLNLSTICINNNLFNKILFMKKIVDKYANNNNILLFNAWNEWGEKMTLEPSNEYGYFNLNTLHSFFTK